jgi:DNA mismatch repair ATPase MutS
MKMASELNGEDLVFTYQLVDGVAERSFAGNVGKMVGICP